LVKCDTLTMPGTLYISFHWKHWNSQLLISATFESFRTA